MQTILNGVNTGHFVRNQVWPVSLSVATGSYPGQCTDRTIAVFPFSEKAQGGSTCSEQFTNVIACEGCIVGDSPFEGGILRHLKEQGMENLFLFPDCKRMPWLSAMDIFMMTSGLKDYPWHCWKQ